MTVKAVKVSDLTSNSDSHKGDLMAIYTYQVDHGDDRIKVSAGMTVNGGRVQAVAFEASLDRLSILESALQEVRSSIELDGDLADIVNNALNP